MLFDNNRQRSLKAKPWCYVIDRKTFINVVSIRVNGVNNFDEEGRSGGKLAPATKILLKATLSFQLEVLSDLKLQ